MLYLGIKGDLPDLSHHTIYLSKEYRRNVQDIEDGLVPPGEPSLYVQNVCVTDPAMAPRGYSTLYVLVPVGNRVGAGIDWAAESAGYRAATLKRLEKLGIHDIEQRIVFEKMTTPTDWEADLDVYRGATFNLAHSLKQMLHFRPRNRFEDLDGVYLVGGGTHPGSGLPVIFESARITSRLLADDLGLQPHLGPVADGGARPTNPPWRRRYEQDGPGRRRRRRPRRPGGGLHPGRARPPGGAVREERLGRRQGGRVRAGRLPVRHGADHPHRAGRAAPHLRRGRPRHRPGAGPAPAGPAMALLLRRRLRAGPDRRHRADGGQPGRLQPRSTPKATATSCA